MPDLANLDLVGWLALTVLLICALAWWPLIREIPSTIAVLAQLVMERRQRPEPIVYLPEAHAQANAGLAADRREREAAAARGFAHAEAARVRRDEMFGGRA